MVRELEGSYLARLCRLHIYSCLGFLHLSLSPMFSHCNFLNTSSLFAQLHTEIANTSCSSTPQLCHHLSHPIKRGLGFVNEWTGIHCLHNYRFVDACLEGVQRIATGPSVHLSDMMATSWCSHWVVGAMDSGQNKSTLPISKAIIHIKTSSLYSDVEGDGEKDHIFQATCGWFADFKHLYAFHSI